MTMERSEAGRVPRPLDDRTSESNVRQTGRVAGLERLVVAGDPTCHD